MFPNPSTRALYIVNSSSVKEKSQIQVINSIGQTVLEETITSNYKNVDLSKLNNGVYFVKIVSDKQSVIKRVVLSR
ncbi:MAG: T9SS type A sorting domain-containing protein [Bacteroidetes bacterium]|nr:T9SS type A sorting domain-containing protein [Bacteroidota bacterium]